MVTKLGRLGRSLGHLIELCRRLQEHHVDLVALDQGIDTSTVLEPLREHEQCIPRPLSEAGERRLTQERDDWEPAQNEQRRPNTQVISLSSTAAREMILRGPVGIGQEGGSSGRRKANDP